MCCWGFPLKLTVSPFPLACIASHLVLPKHVVDIVQNVLGLTDCTTTDGLNVNVELNENILNSDVCGSAYGSFEAYLGPHEGYWPLTRKPLMLLTLNGYNPRWPL